MPDWTAALTGRLAALRLRAEREREIIDELSQHLDERYRELVGAGTPPDEATRLALDDLDDEEVLAREMRRLRQSAVPPPVIPGAPRARLLGDLWQDVVYAGRVLRRTPGFTAAAAVTLALGIGATSALFSLVNATLWQRLPVAHADRLSNVFDGESPSVTSYPAYVARRDGARLLDGLAAWGGITASLRIGDQTDEVSGLIVTGNFFELLGVAPAQGRLLSAGDDRTPMAHPVAVISDRLWRRRFAARPDVVGREVLLNGQPFTVVGVAPPAFSGAQIDGPWRDLYVPMMMQAVARPPRAGYSGEMNPDLLNNPNNGWLFQFARRRTGVSDAQAAAELSALATTYARSRQSSARPVRIGLVPVDAGNPRQRSMLNAAAALLGGVVVAVLLIACANVANLLLSKATARRREVAVRLALGASRARIVRQLLTESVVLAALGGAGGLLLAWLLTTAIRTTLPAAVPLRVDVPLDLRVLLFSAALTVVTGLVCGLAPALQASRPDVVPALRQDSGFSGRWRRFNLRSALVVAQVATSLVLLVGAGLFVRSLQTVQAVEPGYAVDELVSSPLNIQLLRYTRAQGQAFYQRVVERVEALPGVRSASVARVEVLSGGGRTTSVAVEGREDSGDRSQSEGGSISAGNDRTAMVNVVGPRFFETLGIPLRRGRDFGATDTDTSPLVAIVSEAMAARFWPGEEAIGKRFATGFSRSGNPRGDWVEIVGVARDGKYASLGESATPVMYLPLSQRHETGVVLYIRAAGALGPLVPQVRREVQAIEPNLPVPEARTMAETIATSLFAPRLGAAVLTGFSGLALLLGALGLYGVLAFAIARRTREIGIRIALGAGRGSVAGLVLKEGLSLVAAGLAIGLILSVALSGLLRQFLYEVSPRDATTFVAVPLILAAVSLVACYVPARRALRVDPLVALRSE